MDLDKSLHCLYRNMKGVTCKKYVALKFKEKLYNSAGDHWTLDHPVTILDHNLYIFFPRNMDKTQKVEFSLDKSSVHF